MNSPAHTGPRDVFLHLLAIIFLYISVISLGSVLFQYINIAFPDVLSYDYGQYARDALRWPLAMLVIVLPCYLWLMWKLQRELRADPAKRELKTRKWLLYFTLFLTAIVIVGDLVTLVYQFLNGGLSARFILKVLAILAIAGSVSFYYGMDLRQMQQTTQQRFMRLFAWGAIVLMGIAIVVGFFFVGSPFAERQRQFDQRRVSDLSSIQWQIINYWQRKEQLPPTISALRDEIGGYIPPMDPESGADYEYSATGTLSFQLCALFTTQSEDDGTKIARPLDPYGASEVWLHGAGRVCFDRTIDTDLYPPIQKAPVPVR
jgi:MFS family permease